MHSFDPTVNHPRNLAPNVTFHHWGLYGGDKQGASATFTHKVYGKIEGEMVTIDEMIEKLEHTEREISVFKMDCEGVFFSSRLPPPPIFYSPMYAKILPHIAIIMSCIVIYCHCHCHIYC